jgi:CubicO group peptidase (beta-lactamase class C family)
MAERPRKRRSITRRAALANLAGVVCYPFLDVSPGRAAGDSDIGPVFSQDGPNAALYGLTEGYPVPGPLQVRLRGGNPYAPRYRVGAFSHIDEIYPTRRVARAATPWMFKRSHADIRYLNNDRRSSITDYLSRNPVTGLLVAKDDDILCEHYQYGRTDRDRQVSQSMVKSITGLLVGIAAADNTIKSVDDAPEAYVPGFKGTEYGKTPIRDLLHMSSGVEFREDQDGNRDLNRLWGDMITGSLLLKKGTVKSIVQFNRRIAPPGTRYSYASIEPDVLGVVLRYATCQSASDYLHEKVWDPIGAEADATWLVDAEGFEVAHFGFSAVLRDYARFGRLLAHDGAWEGKQVIPAQWMIDATTVRASDAYLAPGKATPGLGYGYLLWLLPGNRRQFALLGQNGQCVCIDPTSKLVMVQTALEDTAEVWRLWSALVAQFG